MGSKSTTIRQVSDVKLFKQDDNLMNIQMLRYYGLCKNINPLSIGKFLIQNIGFFFNQKIFDKLGVSATCSVTQGDITEESIINTLIAQSLIPSDATLDGYFIEDDNQNVINADIYTVKEYLDNNYTYDNSYTKDVTNTYTTTGSDYSSLSVTKTFYKYKVNPNNDLYYEFDSFTQNNDGSYHIKLVHTTTNSDGSTTTDTQYVDTPIDNRIFYLIGYKQNNNIYAILEPSEIFTRENNTLDALIFGLKKNGSNIGDTKYKNALKLKFGLSKNGDDDFEANIMDNTQIKNAFISYTALESQTDYSEQITTLYGTIDDKTLRTVTYTNDDFNITYEYIKTTPNVDDQGNITITKAVVFNGTKIHESEFKDGDIAYILPQTIITSRKTLQEKYNTLRDLLSLVAENEVTIKKKWYQTGFFSFVLTVVTAGTAIYTGNFELFAFMSAGSILINAFVKSPMLKIALGVVMFLVAGKLNLIKLSKMSSMDWTKFGFETTVKLFKADISVKIKKVQSNIRDIQNQTKSYSDIIQNMKRQAIYSPFDLQNFYYNAMYELPYQQFAYITQSTQVNTMIYNPFS